MEAHLSRAFPVWKCTEGTRNETLVIKFFFASGKVVLVFLRSGESPREAGG